MTNPTPREIQLVEAAIKAAAEKCEKNMRGNPLGIVHMTCIEITDAIRSLDPAAIVASVPQPAEQPEDERAQRAREVIEQLAVLDASKKPGGGVHGQILGMEPWIIRTNGYGLQCLYDAQVLIDEVLDPFGRCKTQFRATLSAQEQVEPTDAEILELEEIHTDARERLNVMAFARALLSANQGK